MLNDVVIISLLVLYIVVITGIGFLAIKKRKKTKKKSHLRIVKGSK